MGNEGLGLGIMGNEGVGMGIMGDEGLGKGWERGGKGVMKG